MYLFFNELFKAHFPGVKTCLSLPGPPTISVKTSTLIKTNLLVKSRQRVAYDTSLEVKTNVSTKHFKIRQTVKIKGGHNEI